jgi:hypothetical protein
LEAKDDFTMPLNISRHVVGCIALLAFTAAFAQAQSLGRIRPGASAPLYLVPDAGRQPLVLMEAGVLVEVLKTEGNWLKVSVDGSSVGKRTGYVDARLVEVIPKTPPVTSSTPPPIITANKPNATSVGPPQQAARPTATTDERPSSQSAPVATSTQDSRIRIFVTDSQSWEISGAFAGNAEGFGGTTRGGARPQTAEIIKTFKERCSELTITLDRSKADYVVLLDHEGGKGYALKDNKIAVFDKEGDLLHSGSTRSLGNAVKDGCDAIRAVRRTR